MRGYNLTVSRLRLAADVLCDSITTVIPAAQAAAQLHCETLRFSRLASEAPSQPPTVGIVLGLEMQGAVASCDSSIARNAKKYNYAESIIIFTLRHFHSLVALTSLPYQVRA